MNAPAGPLRPLLLPLARGFEWFAMALLIFAGIRERLDHAYPPKAFRGIALALVTAGLLSLAFMGFSGLV